MTVNISVWIAAIIVGEVNFVIFYLGLLIPAALIMIRLAGDSFFANDTSIKIRFTNYVVTSGATYELVGVCRLVVGV